MKLKPFFSFYGGKYRIAERYGVPGPAIIEPFAGSAGYSVRFHDRAVTLIERDPVIAALWRYLVRVDPREILSIPLVAPEGSVDDLGSVAPEARSLVGFWLNRGMSAPCLRPSAWHRAFQATGERPLSRWSEDAKARIARQVEAIRHWKVIEGDWSEAPDVNATWFVDPPYSGRAGRRYRFNRIDYLSLGAWCQSRRGSVIVCEQAGATWLPFEPFGLVKSTEGTLRDKQSAEVVWRGSGRDARGG